VWDESGPNFADEVKVAVLVVTADQKRIEGVAPGV
jgi:hypothetical protein